ncbi:MAG: hypothetical protein WAN50_02920 [Minisyncoccia bacterium]
MKITQEDYLLRLKNLLPTIRIKEALMMDMDSQAVLDASYMVKTISEECHKIFSELPQTDMVIDLLDAIANIFCLSTFLSYFYEEILTKE